MEGAVHNFFMSKFTAKRVAKVLKFHFPNDCISERAGRADVNQQFAELTQLPDGSLVFRNDSVAKCVEAGALSE